MTTVQLQSEIKIELDEVLDGVSKLDTPELEHFLTEVSVLLAQRKVSNFSKAESRLLQKINQHLPVQTQKRYQQLTKKRQNEDITTEEYEELLALVDTVEQADAERLQALIELSQLRKTSLENLMEKLGITFPDPHD